MRRLVAAAAAVLLLAGCGVSSSVPTKVTIQGPVTCATVVPAAAAATAS